MATRLSVVNDCLAVMGEAPINALSEFHTFKDGALSTLDRVTATVMAKDWWFSMENLTLTVNPVDRRVYLPTDVVTFVPLDDRPTIVQRGRVLYDLKEGTDRFVVGETFDLIIKRSIPLEDMPASVGNYIARRTVLEFQHLYDGDQTKTRNLTIEVYGNPQMQVMGLRAEAEAEHIRNRKVNLLDNSLAVNRVRRAYRRSFIR